MDALETLKSWVPVVIGVGTIILGILLVRLRSEITNSQLPLHGDLKALEQRVALVEQRVEAMPTDSQLADLRGELRAMKATVDHMSEGLSRVSGQIEFTNRLLLEGKRA